MVPAHLDEPLVEGMGDDIVVVGTRAEGTVEERLQLQRSAHPSQFEVAQPQLAPGQIGLLSEEVEGVGLRLNSSSVTSPGSVAPVGPKGRGDDLLGMVRRECPCLRVDAERPVGVVRRDAVPLHDHALGLGYDLPCPSAAWMRATALLAGPLTLAPVRTAEASAANSKASRPDRRNRQAGASRC